VAKGHVARTAEAPFSCASRPTLIGRQKAAAHTDPSNGKCYYVLDVLLCD